MGKLKFTLSNIIFWLSIAATCLLLEDVGFLTTTPKGPLNTPIFFMLLVLSLGGYLSYFLIEHIKNKASVDFVLLGTLLIGFGASLIAIWMFDGVSFSGIATFEYQVEAWDKIRQTFLLAIYFLTIYSVLFYFNKNHPSIRKVAVIYFIIIVIALIASIYSWIKELDAIVYNLSGHSSPTSVNSIFWNANMFSLMLLLGMFSCFGLNYFKKNVIWYLLIVYFAMMICFVASLTAIITCFVSIVFYFLVEIIFVIKRHRARGVTFLAIYLTILTSIVVLLAVSLNYDLGYFSSFLSSIYRYFTEANFVSYTGRTQIWSEATNFLVNHPLNFMFGVGFKNSYPVVGGLMHAYKGWSSNPLSTHNGYIQILMNFGLIGLILYALFFIYYVYCLIRLLKKDPRFAVIYGLIGFALLGYASMESIIFLNPNTLGLLICAFFFLPVTNKWKHYIYPKLANDVIEVQKPTTMPAGNITKSLAKLFMGLIAVACAFFIFPVVRENKDLLYLVINIIVALFICALTVPYIVSCISIRHSRKVGMLLSIINFIIVASPFIYLGLRYHFYPHTFASGAEWLFPVFMIIILFGEAIIFGVGKRQGFKKYASTLVGMSKNSFMGLLGALAIILTSYFIIDYLDTSSGLTYIIYPVIILLAYYLASYLIPFKDQKAFTSSYNESLLYSLKKDVLKDRLGDFNEKRRD